MENVFLIPKPQESQAVKILSLKWSGTVKGEVLAELPCSRCDKPIGNKKPFAIAFVENKNDGMRRSHRLCNECGIEAEKILK